ncbi:MAG: site-specific integrase [Rickettsiaceae bacterium]|jgi:integrase|nr:site-specific integrase [Rickettsiaceae bacterium]
MKKKEKQDQFNPKNERIKYQFRIHTKRAIKKDEKTIIAELQYLREYELFSFFADFETYNSTKADKYINYLFDQDYSLSYINDALRTLKIFLVWLERQKGYRSKIQYNDIDYLNITNNQRRASKATEHKKSYSFDQIVNTIRQMPGETMIERRNKAIISANALCSLRISELRTVKLKNLIEEDGKCFIHINPKDIDSKTAKARYADCIGLPQDIFDNVINWKNELVAKFQFGSKDPLFPKIPSNFNQFNLLESTITKEEIKSGSQMRDIFRNAFEKAGLEYINPHNFRHTRARFAMKQSPQYLNAIRQSLGHKNIDTTLSSYGELSIDEQREVIAGVKIGI